MANITIKNLEIASTQLQQLFPGEMEKVIGGFMFIGQFSQITNRLIAVSLIGIFLDLIFSLLSTGWGGISDNTESTSLMDKDLREV